MVGGPACASFHVPDLGAVSCRGHCGYSQVVSAALVTVRSSRLSVGWRSVAYLRADGEPLAGERASR